MISKLNKSRINIDFMLGFALAIPLNYPKDPFYLVAIVVFPLAVLRMKFDRKSYTTLALVSVLSITSMITNFLSPFPEHVNYLSAIATAITFYFFLFRFCLRDVEKFFDGYLLINKIYTVLVFVAFITLQPFVKYSNFFVNSEARMWAIDYLPEWPNVFCVFLVISFLINVARKNSLWALLNITAALLTTSRMALLGLLIFIVFYIVNSKYHYKIAIGLFLTVLMSLFSYFLIENPFIQDYIEHRLFKTSDRSLIVDALLNVSSQYPLGIGNIPFDAIDSTYESYHSSFLKVAVRYGLPSLLVYIFLLWPYRFTHRFFNKVNMVFVFLFIVGMVQDMLFHMHFIYIFSALLLLREEVLFRQKELNGDHP